MPLPRCHDCKSPLRGRDGRRSRCTPCRQRRRSWDHAYNREIAEALFPPRTRAAMLRRLANGQTLRDACAALAITPQAAFGFRAFDPEWAGRLDAALMAGRDPDLAHGTESAYRIGKCRCPECRAAKNARRQVTSAA